jgi:hypothetical protein
MLQDDKIEPKARDDKNGWLIMQIMDVGKNISLYASFKNMYLKFSRSLHFHKKMYL